MANPGENPNLPYQPYNLLQIGEVTVDTGGGVLALRTTGGGGGGGDATAANQLLQIDEAITSNSHLKNIEDTTTLIQSDNLSFYTTTAPLLTDIDNNIQTTATSTNNIDNNTVGVGANTLSTAGSCTNIDSNTDATATSCAGILSDTDQIVVSTSVIQVNTTNIAASTSSIDTKCTAMQSDLDQLKGSLCPCAFVQWATGLPNATPGAGHMIVGFLNETTGLWVNPLTLTTPTLTGDEILVCLQHSGAAAFINYTNNVAKTSRTFVAASAPVGVTIRIFYASAH